MLRVNTSRVEETQALAAGLAGLLLVCGQGEAAKKT